MIKKGIIIIRRKNMQNKRYTIFLIAQKLTAQPVPEQ